MLLSIRARREIFLLLKTSARLKLNYYQRSGSLFLVVAARRDVRLLLHFLDSYL